MLLLGGGSGLRASIAGGTLACAGAAGVTLARLAALAGTAFAVCKNNINYVLFTLFAIA